ncbi:ubiquinol-cytochrome c reductase iron-sulfur subunit [Robiginitalea marina]|uniref:Rieske 2Fe-2S domain-containing protein n=1 Tax=Robiginitalea marina TaxID=2954105 RepID=A0ABT1AVK2_9FLAO|nr:Rieske 2Fe-2S domain-containing protein [Robiginitalea marina]MCO5724098.1 Rieske 2Fe-2S domain-containing protein [Robiginitalea marina]
MERKAFLRSLGAGAAFALTFPCLQGCSKDGEPGGGEEVPTGVDFTIDLSGPDGTALQDPGDFIVRNDVVVARNLEGQFVAASRICSHEQNPGVSFVDIQGGIFECYVHGSRFAQDGTPLNAITQNPLKIFNTTLSGNLLRVFD